MSYSTDVYRQVARLHANNLDQGFLSTLGVSFLTELYRAIDHCPQSVLIIKTDQDKVVGFVAGLLGPMTQVYKQMMQRFFIWSITLIPVFFSLSKIRRVIEILRYSKKTVLTHTESPSAELLSIAVDPAHRGNGTAERLYIDLTAYFKKNNILIFKIVVGEKLLPAHKFYRRMGALPLSSIQIHHGANSTMYIHDLQFSRNQS